MAQSRYPSRPAEAEIVLVCVGAARAHTADTEMRGALHQALPPCAATAFDAHAATNFNAYARAGDLSEACAILCAWILRNRIGRTGPLCGFARLSGWLSGCVGRQRCNNGRKDDFSHQCVLACAFTPCSLNGHRVRRRCDSMRVMFLSEAKQIYRLEKSMRPDATGMSKVFMGKARNDT